MTRLNIETIWLAGFMFLVLLGLSLLNSAIPGEQSLNVSLSLENQSVFAAQPVNLTLTVNQPDTTNWTGSADCNITVDQQVISLNATKNQSNNVTLPVLSEGRHWIQARCTDAFSRNGSTGMLQFTVDTSAPHISVIGPENTTVINSSIAFSFSVSDNASEESGCRLFLDSLQAANITAKNGSITKINKTLAEGMHEWYISCTDIAGHVSNSTARSVDVKSFGLSVSSANYGISEQALITFSGAQGTAVDAQVTRLDRINNVWFSTAFSVNLTSTALIYSFNDTEFSGAYTIDALAHYLNESVQASKGFAVDNTLTAGISTAYSEIQEGSTASFSGSAVNGIAPYQYSWHFGDQGTSSAQNASHTYTDDGNYQVMLRVTDTFNNTKTAGMGISVKYYKSVRVLANEGTPLSSASVSIDSSAQLTNATGQTLFKLFEGNYSITVSKSGYKSYIGYIVANESNEVSFTLAATSAAPAISIEQPGSITQGEDIELGFKVDHGSETTCSIYLSRDGSLWKLHSTVTVPANNNGKDTLSGLDAGITKVRIECIDNDDNLGISAVSEITVAEKQETADKTAETDEFGGVLSEIDEVSRNFSSMSSKQREAFEALVIGKRLNDAREEILRINRDLHNVVYRRDLDEQGKENLQQELNSRFLALKESIPNGITVVASEEYVVYPTNDQVRQLARDYLAYRNISLGKTRSGDFQEQAVQIQSALSVSTQIKHVILNYLYRDPVDLTLVSQTIIKNEDIRGINLVVSIPKEAVGQGEDLTFYQKVNMLQADPVFEIGLEENITQLSYSFEGFASFDSLKSIVFAAMTEPDVRKQLGSSNIFTGFTVLKDVDLFGLDLSQPMHIMLVVLVFGAMGVYLFFTLDLSHVITGRQRAEHAKLIELRQRGWEMESLLRQNAYEKAAKLYTEMQLIFEGLDAHDQNNTIAQLTMLGHQANVGFVKKSVDEALRAIARGTTAEAAQIYEDISETYEELPPRYKAEVSQPCTELFEALQK